LADTRKHDLSTGLLHIPVPWRVGYFHAVFVSAASPAKGYDSEELEALAPRFVSQVPHDVISGEPYKYRRTDDGQFLLYSVGWNEKDDGGVPGKTLFDDKQGDWVWQYPPPQ
jgi:hypothetical protein